MEYALGVPASGAASPQLPTPGWISNHLSLTFTRPAAATDIVYTVQVSDDLVTWHDGSRYSGSGDTTDNAFTSQIARSSSNGLETIVVQDTTPSAGVAKHFIRLKVTSE